MGKLGRGYIIKLQIWEGVAMEFLKFLLALICPTLLCPVGGLSLI
jgi:hypothetical protein